MNTHDSIGTRMGQITDEGVRLSRAAWGTAAAYVAGLTIVGTGVDQMSDIGAGNLVFAVISLALGFLLTVNLLRGGGLAPSGLQAGFGAYFGLALLGGLGMILGVLMLVIPGVVLFVRWSPAYGYALADGLGVSDALGKAWRETAAHFWPLALALLVPLALNVGAGAVYVLASDDNGMIGLPVSVVANAVMSVAGAGITVVGIAAYSLLRDRSEELAEVFA